MILSEIRHIQPKAWELLSRSVASGRVASTYLFSGKEGLGHWPLALSFAALLNCENRSEADGVLVPCGECPTCHQIATLNAGLLQIVLPIPSHKDMKEAIDLTNASLEIKRAEPFAVLTSNSQLTVPIDMAREVKRRLSLKGNEREKRVALFYQMEKMLTASADALLKLIEEPPADTVIILTAEKAESLLPTIRSRSQMLRLERIRVEVCAQYLATKYGVAPEKALLAAKVTDGNLGRGVELVSGEEEDELSQRAVGFLIFKSLVAEPGPEAVSRALEFIQDRGQAEAIYLLWGALIRDCANYAVTGDEAQIINLDHAADIKRLSAVFVDPEVAPAMAAAIKNALADLRLNVHIQPSVAALALRLGAAIRTAR